MRALQLLTAYTLYLWCHLTLLQSPKKKNLPLSLSSLASEFIQQPAYIFIFQLGISPSSFPLAATAAVKCLKHQRRTKIGFSLRLGYASLRWSTSSFCPFAVAVQNFFAFAVDGVLGILARDPASTTHPRRSFIMLPGPRRDERHAHLIMCIYSEINFYFGHKKKKTEKPMQNEKVSCRLRLCTDN